MQGIKNAGYAQKIRGSIKRRNAKQNTLCERGQAPTPNAAVIADSLFTLRLKPKPGCEVYFNQRGDDSALEHKDCISMYNDVYSSFANFYTQQTGHAMTDVHKLGLDAYIAFHHILTQMKMLLPAGYDFNIEYDESSQQVQKYFLVIFYECDWRMWWHTLEIGEALPKLRRNKSLYSLFLSFLKALQTVGVDLWDDGFMGSTLWVCREDYIHQQHAEYGPESAEYKTARKELNSYTRGEALKVLKEIRKAEDIAPADLVNRAKRFKKDNEIANLIYQGANILKTGCKLTEYCYQFDDMDLDYHGGEFLSLDSQCNIVWLLEDFVGSNHAETLDAVANNGYVQNPVLSLRLYADTKVDFAELAKRAQWPMQLSDFFSRADELITKYLKNE